MEGVKFLNLEYLILSVYNLFHSVDVASLPTHLLVWVDIIQTFGIFISLFFLALLVYAKIRFSQMFHENHHAREHLAHELMGHTQEKNPRWAHVMDLIQSGSASDWRQAIIEADVLLDEMLTEVGLPGETLGEKLKSASRAHFTTLDLAWEAHKVRNDIAHGGSAFVLTDREAKRAIDLFRQVFEEFRFI